MKFNHAIIRRITILFTVLIAVQSAIFGQVTTDIALYAQERRPFDFSDKYYGAGGIDPERLFNRRDGADGRSLFDYSSDPNYRGVRITATNPAYGPDGKLLYWNQYADLPYDAFLNDESGRSAAKRSETLSDLYVPEHRRRT